MRIYQSVLIGITIIIIGVFAAYLFYGGNGKGVTAIGGQFQLTDHTGQKRTSESFNGQYTLVYFGYTFCPDVCPTGLQVMTLAINQLDDKTQDKIIPLFITIDPERDTVEQLSSYVSNFHPRLIGLTGTADQIAKAARAFRVYYSKSKQNSGASSDYLLDHSSIIYLMDTEGTYVTHFTHTTTVSKIVDILNNKLRP
ncbi:MAG: SCO family protein [Pseudomonadota bacterium]|nr:SCO family protein [Pseudomonadota bacterium]